MHAPSLLALWVLAVPTAFAASLRTRDGNFGNNLPGLSNDSIWAPNDYPMTYPDPKVLFKWTNKKAPLNITVVTDVSRCTAGDFRYKNQYIPYNEESTHQLEGHVFRDAKIDNTDYYVKTNFTATDTFRGRLMLTDQPEMNKRIGLMSVRIDFSAEESRAWVDTDPDEETKQSRLKIAPISYVWWKSQTETGEKTGYLGQTRGFKDSLRTTKLKKDTLYVQWC
ncbi:hypothetical protein CBS101457_003162 [Exobasidium rhododendri]|nr:hypothetical protein CBS101457_003162 [Exobasidium rhododendri]